MRSKIEKFSTFIFFARNFLFFLIKEKKIFLFCVPAVAGKRKRSPLKLPQFLPACLGFALKFFWRLGYSYNI